MMKRIISLILVAVMSLLMLASCAYSYDNDKMSNYATFDSAKFTEMLGKLEIEDADFGTDEEKRQLKVLDKIFTALAKLADTEDKKVEGTPAKYDTFYYCYFCTGTDADGEFIVFASNMKESGATKLQLGMSTLEGINKLIADKVTTLDIKDYLYATDTAEKTKLGDTVYVSYTKTYIADKLDKDGNPVLDEDGKPVTEEKKETVSYKKVTLPTDALADGANPTFLDKLVDVKPETTQSKIEVTENGVKCTYTSVKVNWVVESMPSDEKLADLTFKDTTYGKDDTEKKVKDIYGKEHKLNGVELTYYVFPVYYLSVQSELTADVVLKDLLADDITVDSLECFKDEKYKNGDESLEKLVEKLAELQVELASKKDAVESAEDDLEDAQDDIDAAGGEDKATSEEKEALKDAEEALKEAEEDLADAEKKVNDQIAKIYACGEDIKTVIVDQYKESQYDDLEDSYKYSIKQNLAAAIYEYAEKYISYTGKLPEQAVSEAYNKLMNNYKYDFYEGTYDDKDSSSSSSSSKKESNYKVYEGNFESFIKAELGLKESDPMQKVYDKVGLEAENSVKELILVYTLAELYGDAVDVTDEDIADFKKGYNYLILQYTLGTNNVKEEYYIHALQLDNILNHLLEEKDEKDYAEDSVYGENKVQYKRVTYTFKSDEAEKE